MDCSVIYYAARKTSFCEKALNRCLSPLHLRISSACFANGAQQLGERLIEAWSTNGICAVVGGMEFTDERAVTRIISNAAASSRPETVRKLPCTGGCGYLLRAGSQLLLLLPDDPGRIEEILRGDLSDYIRNTII